MIPNDKDIICSYGFKPQQGVKAHGMGFEKEIAPSLTAAANQGVLISYGFEPGVAQRLNPEGRFYKELSPTLRAKAGDNQVSAAIIKDESTSDP